MSRLVLLAALLAAQMPACAAPPVASPGKLGSNILAELDRGDADAAADLFRQAVGRRGYLDRIYPVLYETARDRFQEGDSAGSALVLRFMAPRYPDSTAVREALLYALLIERSRADSADQDLLDEMARTLDEVRARPASLSTWMDLVETQLSIDLGRLPEARAAYQRFRDVWDGTPAALAVYVEEIERYLQSH